MVPLDPKFIGKLGGKDLSAGDILRINTMYECEINEIE